MAISFFPENDNTIPRLVHLVNGELVQWNENKKIDWIFSR
jgi:hypothetical protein